jgi:hypothetical protein
LNVVVYLACERDDAAMVEPRHVNVTRALGKSGDVDPPVQKFASFPIFFEWMHINIVSRLWPQYAETNRMDKQRQNIV